MLYSSWRRNSSNIWLSTALPTYKQLIVNLVPGPQRCMCAVCAIQPNAHAHPPPHVHMYTHFMMWIKETSLKIELGRLPGEFSRVTSCQPSQTPTGSSFLNYASKRKDISSLSRNNPELALSSTGLPIRIIPSNSLPSSIKASPSPSVPGFVCAFATVCMSELQCLCRPPINSFSGKQLAISLLRTTRHVIFICIWLGFNLRLKQKGRVRPTKGTQMVGWWFLVSLTVLLFLSPWEKEMIFITRNKAPLLDSAQTHYKTKCRLSASAGTASGGTVPSAGQQAACCGYLDEGLTLPCPFKHNSLGGATSF